jgi:hypothetical protein
LVTQKSAAPRRAARSSFLPTDWVVIREGRRRPRFAGIFADREIPCPGQFSKTGAN